MVLDIEFSDIEEILNSYEVSFSRMGVKGRINYSNKTIELNPLFSNCQQTLMHEVMHHHIDNMVYSDFSESDIDEYSRSFLEKNPEIDSYLFNFIENIDNS